MSSKREQSIAGRKARILDAARTIIAREGYDALTTRGIAQAAGVTAPTLYNLVGDKAAIISAMATASIEELWGRLHLDERGHPLAMADAILDEAFAQILADPEANCATFIALERMGIAFSYHPTREDAGAHSARRSIEMAQYVCEAAQRTGQLRGNQPPHELALQMFAVYRAPLDDWVHRAITAQEMLRRQRIGFYTVLAADASDEFREELLGRIADQTSATLEQQKWKSQKWKRRLFDMILEKILKVAAGMLPLIFAFAFLAPVIDQGMQALGLAAPLGLSTLTLGLVVAGAWGLFAQVSGRWI